MILIDMIVQYSLLLKVVIQMTIIECAQRLVTEVYRNLLLKQTRISLHGSNLYLECILHNLSSLRAHLRQACTVYNNILQYVKQH